MKYRFLLLLLLTLGATPLLFGQETQIFTLKQTVNRAWNTTNQSKISKEQVETAKQELRSIENTRYPDVSISGNALYLPKPDLNIKLPSTSNSENSAQEGGMPNPHYLLAAQANLAYPIFSGFKIKNTVEAGKNRYKSSQFIAQDDNEKIALQTVQYFVELYKARKMVKLLNDEFEASHRRVEDFSAMEKNELIPLNDLLKVKLREAQVKLSLSKAEKASHILNYQIATFLKLPEKTQIITDSTSFDKLFPNTFDTLEVSRSDIKAIEYQNKAAKDNIKIQKGNYYPSIALTGGILTANLQNTLIVNQAVNFGIGLKYDLSNIFKNKSNVRLAKSKERALKYQLDEAKDQVSVQIQDAKENYQLALENYQVFRESKQQAEENYKLVKEKFDNGLEETRDLLEADVQRLQSRMDLTTGKAMIAQRYYELRQAQGILTNEFKDQD